MIIEKKIWPKFFKEVKSGNKKFEFRLADFKCKKGDILVLKVYNPKTKKYTGKSIRKKISFVVKSDGTEFWAKKDIKKYGFQIIFFK